MVDKAPTSSPVAKCLDKAIQLSSNGTEAATIIPAGAILPITVKIDASVASASGYLKLSVAGNPADPVTDVGEVVFNVNKAEGEGATAVVVGVSVSVAGEIKLEVTQNSEIIGNLVIPAAL